MAMKLTLADAVEEVEPAVGNDHVAGELPNHAGADSVGGLVVLRVQKGRRKVQLLLCRKNCKQGGRKVFGVTSFCSL